MLAKIENACFPRLKETIAKNEDRAPPSILPPYSSTSSPQPQHNKPAALIKSAQVHPIQATQQKRSTPSTPHPSEELLSKELRLAYCSHPSCHQLCSITLHHFLASLYSGSSEPTSTDQMACPFCRIQAWSRRKLQSSSKPRPRYTTLAPLLPHKRRDHEPPPPYPNVSPEPIAGSETLEPLASRNSSPAQKPADVRMPPPPPPMATLRLAADAAAAAAESVASICAEDPVGCGDWPPELVAHRVRNDAHNALETALGPDAAGHAWPLVFDDDNFHLSKSRRRNPFPTGGVRSFESSPLRPNAVLDMTNLVISMCQL